MNIEFKKTLTRFKREDFGFLLERWHSITIEDFNEFSVSSVVEIIEWPKSTIVNRISNLCLKKSLGKSAVNQIDLISKQLYPTKKIWSMFTMEKVPGNNYPIEDAKSFSRRLKHQLKLFYKFDLDISVYKQAFWLRIAILDARGEGVPFYVVHFPQTDFLAVLGLKSVHKDGFMRAFVNSKNYHSMNAIQLKGYHLYSLFQLLHNKYPNGGLEAYKEELVEVPGTHARTRSGEKRTLSDDEEAAENISFEEEGITRKKRALLDRAFGEEILPTLQKVEYKLETKFRGLKFAPEMAEHKGVFGCSVRFEGSNVLEGIKNLAKAGMASLPLNDHVGKIHLLARNHFNLRMKASAMGEASGLDASRMPNMSTLQDLTNNTKT